MLLLHSFIPTSLSGRTKKFKTANFLAAVVADLLHNFNGPSGQESAFYSLSRYEILLSQIGRLPQSANKFEVQ